MARRENAPPRDFSRTGEKDCGSFWNAGSPDSAGLDDPHATLVGTIPISSPASADIPAQKFSPSLTCSLWGLDLRPAERFSSSFAFRDQSTVPLLLPIKDRSAGQLWTMQAWRNLVSAMWCVVPTYAQPSRASPDPKLRQDQALAALAAPVLPCTGTGTRSNLGSS